MNHHFREPRSAIHHSGTTLLKRACVSCPGDTPTCNCAPDEDCVLTSRTCDQCPQIQCNPKSESGSNSSSKSGVNAGVIAGPVVAVVVLVAISAGLWWLWKRRKARDLAALESFEKRATLQRSVHSPNTQQRTHSPLPDLGPRTGNNLLSTSPSGDFPSDIRPSMDTLHALGVGNTQTKVYHGDANIDLSRSGQHDPFDDGRSIATDQMSFGSTNFIPIAYLPPSRDETDGAQDKLTAGEKLDAARRALGTGFTGVGPPTRPTRAPDLDLRLRPTNGGNKPPTSYNHQELVETLGTGSRDLTTSRLSVLTTRTGVSAVPSFMSGSTEFAHEAPQIVTRREVQTGVVQQAAVVDWSGNDRSGNGMYGRNLTAIDRRYGDGYNPGDQSPSASSMRSGVSNTSDPFSDRRADRSSGNTFGKMLYSTDGHEASESGHLPGSEPHLQELGTRDTSDDLRFSMGSLAMGGLQGRDSYGSTMTGWSVGQVQVGQAQRVNLTPHGPTYRTMDLRQSVVSTRSEASSFLNAIIPPSANGGNSNNASQSYPHERLPTNMSANTLNHESRPLQGREAVSGARRALVSTTSEGLSGFDFAFEDGPPLPVQPAQRRPA